MTELPGTPWRGDALDGERCASGTRRWRRTGARPGRCATGFTHFELVIDLLAARVPRIEADGFLRPATALEDEALPSVMRKCIRMAAGGPPRRL